MFVFTVDVCRRSKDKPVRLFPLPIISPWFFYFFISPPSVLSVFCLSLWWCGDRGPAGPRGRSCSQGNSNSPQSWYQNSLKCELSDSSQWVESEPNASRSPPRQQNVNREGENLLGSGQKNPVQPAWSGYPWIKLFSAVFFDCFTQKHQVISRETSCQGQNSDTKQTRRCFVYSLFPELKCQMWGCFCEGQNKYWLVSGSASLLVKEKLN